jgi:DNA-binding transcriptional MocR family regulator
MPINSFDNYPMSWRPQLGTHTGILYKTLAAQLEKDIRQGALKPGTKLPPQRELADYLDINLSTVTKAYRLCSLKGLLQTSVGRGTYVAYDVMNSLQLWPDNWQNPHVIPMGATRPDNASYAIVRQQLQELLAEPDSLKWFDYGSKQDMAWHRHAGAVLLAHEGFPAQIENIFMAAGVQNALMAALMSCCSYGDTVGADSLTYPGLKGAAAALGIRLIPIPTQNNSIDYTMLASLCQKMPLKALYLMPQNQNPTTYTIDLEARRKIAEFASYHHLSIIEDASYNLLSSTALQPIASFIPERTFFLGGLSKGIAPGLRLAYMAVPSCFRAAVTNALYTMSITVSPLMSELAARLIVSGTAQKALSAHKKETVARSYIVQKYLQPFLSPADDACIFRWLHLPAAWKDGTAFEAAALQHGVQVYAAERFALGDTSPENAVRLAITSPINRQELIKGLLILKTMLCTSSQLEQ